MKKTIVLCLGMVFGIAVAAQAQATRTWVSGVGDDANPCSRTAPCKTFAGAISKTATGGYIDALDPGGFGAVTITKSITIDGGPGLAGITFCSSTQAILVNGANIVVALRNLSLEGCGNGVNGIRILAAAQVHVENVTIANFTTNGIFQTTATTSLFADNVTIKDTQNGQGVQVQGGTCVLDHMHVNGTETGILVGPGGNCTVKNSVVAGGNIGVAAAYGSGAQLTVQNSVLSNNTYGVLVAGGATVRLSSCTITNNTMIGMYNDGSSFLVSFVNNSFAGNASDGAFTSTISVK